MFTNNFYPSFQWFTGIVRDRVDPLGIGRLRVSIFGYYDGIADKDLPWAYVLLPTNGTKSFSSPELGDWVMGFFLDGQSAQFPVIMGVIPGLKNNKEYQSMMANSSTTTPAVLGGGE